MNLESNKYLIMVVKIIKFFKKNMRVNFYNFWLGYCILNIKSIGNKRKRDKFKFIKF